MLEINLLFASSRFLANNSMIGILAIILSSTFIFEIYITAKNLSYIFLSNSDLLIQMMRVICSLQIPDWRNN